MLDLEVGGGVDELADSGFVVELAQELACLEVIAYLRELVAYGALAVGRARELVGGVSDGVKDGSRGFTGGLAIGDCDDEDGLVELVGANFLDDEGVEDLVAELCAHWGQTLELNARDELLDFGFVVDVVALEVAVHEADLNPISVKEGGSKGDLGEDEL